MRRIAGLSDIADQFDLYLVDQYGVLHDGVAAYPGVIDGLVRLRSRGSRVIVLTNSGKDAAQNRARLAALGIEGSYVHAVVSSGDVGLHLVRSGALGPRFAIGAECCVIGRSADQYAVSAEDFRLVDRTVDAAFLVFAGSDAPRTPLEAYRAMLTPAAQAGIPALCVNPDLTMIRDGELVPAPGAIARVYEGLGGLVDYVGKPEGAIFRHALDIAGTWTEGRVVMIGDSPEHDVAGAKAMGLRTLLVRTGIHQSLAEPQLLGLCVACGGTPDFLVPAFKW
jgi:HAD superfamily hydrolase (TIGR01459 family)